MAICFTVVLDKFHDKTKAASLISLLNSFITGATTIAPVLGAYIGEFISWRANFALLAAGGFLAFILTWLFLSETLAPHQKSKWIFKKAFREYLSVLKSSRVWHLGLIPILIYSTLIVYMVNFPLMASPFFKDIRWIGYLQGSIMLCFVLGSVIASYILQKQNVQTIMKFAYSLTLLGGLLLVIGSYVNPNLWILFTVFVCMISAGSAFIIGLYMGKSLDVFPEKRGVSTAVQGFLRLTTSSIIVMISGYVLDESVSYITLLMFICILISFCLYRRDIKLNFFQF